MADLILLKGVRVASRLGVPDEERAALQTLEIDAEIEPRSGLGDLNDELDGTIDYFAVMVALRDVAAERPRKLIETLAEDMAARIMEDWPVARVKLTVRKFILPDTDSVAVVIERGEGIGES